MIKKIKSKLAVKVFLFTAVLMAACCAITYLCIVRFAPYIYTHDVTEAENFVCELSLMLNECSKEEGSFVIQEMSDILAKQTEDEFAFHIFKSSGEETELLHFNSATGKRLQDFRGSEKTEQYTFVFYDDTEEYTVLAAQNTDKESQVVEALQKSLPILSMIVFVLSVTVALFYTWYLTRPIKKVSSISRQMAGLDFGSRCPIKRTDEIGILSDSLNELSGKLSAALLELQEANQKLQADIDRERELERQRLEFFSAASHELKTPITIVKGQLEGMLYQVGRYKDRETYLAGSLEVINTLEKMVQELLTISRLDTPGYVCSKTDFDFGRLADERLALYEDLFMQRELTFEKFLSPDIYIRGDRRLLEKVLDNLFSNAAAYSPAGSRVSVKLWREGETVHFTVENTGVHIPDEDLPKLFEAFYRVDQSRSRQTGGSGLGLYIVKTILDLHEAEIEIANTVQGVAVVLQFS